MPETMTARGPLRKTVKTTAHYDRIAIRHGQDSNPVTAVKERVLRVSSGWFLQANR